MRFAPSDLRLGFAGRNAGGAEFAAAQSALAKARAARVAEVAPDAISTWAYSTAMDALAAGKDYPDLAEGVRNQLSQFNSSAIINSTRASVIETLTGDIIAIHNDTANGALAYLNVKLAALMGEVSALVPKLGAISTDKAALNGTAAEQAA